MARCRCTNECTCSVRAGTNVGISGSGTVTDPWIINANPASIMVADTVGVDLTIHGTGTLTDPFVLSADLSCIDCTSAAPTGYVLARDASGRYVPQPSTTADPGAIATGVGLVGDGSGGSPLRVDLCTYADLKAVCATP